MKNIARRRAAALLTAILLTANSACEQYTTAPSIRPTRTATPAQASAATALPSGNSKGWLLLSVEEDGYAHLFTFSIATAKLTRITWGDWNDITPALSPDGNTVAFASDRGGHWDLYKLNLQTAAVTQITDTPEYDASPTWSPDLAWMAYETYQDGHLDIAIQSLTDPTQAPVLLTDDEAADHSPVWAPNGREIAFVSNRTGDADIWLADLNKAQGRFTDLSLTPQAAESHPTWSPDGTRLAWASARPSPDYAGVYIWDASIPDQPAQFAGEGDWPCWSPSMTEIATTLAAPNSVLITAYSIGGQPVTLPTRLPGLVRGLAWPGIDLPSPLPIDFQVAAGQTPQSLVPASVTPQEGVPSKRWYVVPLEDVQAPSAQLHALVAPSFEALRKRVIGGAGWDPLASLENAFVPLTTALDPGLQEDWLYTGRAFALNSLMLNAGWIAAVREDIGTQTYWRIYIRTQNQDGSQGAPIEDPPWDLNARFQLDPAAYEAGGAFARVPPGYWIDLTSLASAYGWERLPALQNWRSYYPGARFTEFAMTSGLTWYAAMLELYPIDALVTATPVLPPTITPSRTPYPSSTPYPTSTPGPTQTPRATLTPSKTSTPRPPTTTPIPTSTPPTIIPTFPSPTP